MPRFQCVGCTVEEVSANLVFKTENAKLDLKFVRKQGGKIHSSYRCVLFTTSTIHSLQGYISSRWLMTA